MRLILTLMVALFLLAACQPMEPPQVEPTQADDADHDVPALPDGDTPTNAELFGNGVDVRTEEVNYCCSVNGYFAEPTEPGDYPGVVMIHEWWGLNEEIKTMASNLAAKGYRVLAVDLFNGEVATTPERARELVGEFDQQEALDNLRTAAYFLETRGSQRVASLGWCFGGKQSLELSLARPMDATVIYYGQLRTSADELSSLQGPVLGIFGAEDSSIPVEAVEAFSSALDEKMHDKEIHIYDGVGHAFANPSGSNFAPEQTKDAWNKTITFLNDIFK